MADEACNKKLEDLQKYIPFLQTMISQLQNPNKEREKQLNKIVSLLSMITEKKKLKMETLNKCEEVILQLLNRVKHKPSNQTSSNEVSTNKSTDLSLPRDATTSKEIISKPILKDRVYKNDGYFAKKPSVFDRLGSKILSPAKRPIISFQELSLLQNDVKELYNERRSSYVPKTKLSFHSELALLKEKIQSKKDYSSGDKVIDKSFTITKSVTTVYEHRRSEVEEEKNYLKPKPKSFSSSTRNDRIRYDRSPSYEGNDRYWWKYEKRRSVSLDREIDDRDKCSWRKERRSDSSNDFRRDSRERSYSREERKYKRRSNSTDTAIRDRRSWSNDRRRRRSSSREKLENGERRKYDRSVSRERRKYDRSLSRERNEDKDRRFSKDVIRYRRSISKERIDKDRRLLKDERGYRRSVSRERTEDRRYTTSERKYERLEDKEKRYPRIEYHKRRSEYSPTRRSEYSPNRNRSYRDFRKEERRSKSRERYNEPRSIAYKIDHEEKEDTKDSRPTINDSSKNNNKTALPDMLKKVDNNSVPAESAYDLILDEVRKEVVPSPEKSGASASNNVVSTPYSPVDSNSDMDISTDDDEEKATSSFTPVKAQNVPLPFPFPTHSIPKVPSYPKSSVSTQMTRVVTNRTLTVITTTDVFNQFGKSSTPSPGGSTISTPSHSQQLLSIEAAPQSTPKLLSPTPSEPPPILSPQCERPSKQLIELERESRYLEYKYRPPASSPVDRDSKNVRECSRLERTCPNEENRKESRSRSRSASRPRSVSPVGHRSRPKVKRLRSMTPDSSSESPDRGGKPSRSASTEADDENRKTITPEVCEKKVEISDVKKTIVETEESPKTDCQVENNEVNDEVKESKPNDKSKEDVEQAEIINNFLKKLLEDERTRAAASTFIKNVSDSVEDEELKTVVQAIKSESLEPVVKTKINVRGSNRQKPIIEDEESSVEDEPVAQREKTKTGRHYKSELDLLHDDIRNMFIKDGLLTSTGQRMCRLLKNDTARTTAERFDCKDPNNWKTLKYMKSAFVSIPRLTLDSQINDDKTVISPVNIDPSEEKPDDRGRYSLRDIKKGSVNYLEIDSEDENKRRKKRRLEEEERERYPLRLVSKPVYREESSDDEMNMMKRRTSHKEKEPEKKIGETEQVSIPKSDEKNEATTKEENCSASSTPKKINYKKRGKAWASGVIPKKKKSKPTRTETTTTFVEPDKNYYFRKSMRSGALCKLCDEEVRNVTLHYRMEHPDSEILSSRLSPRIAEQAIQESIRLNLGGLPDEIVPQNFTCIYKCRFCDSTLKGGILHFQGHIASHTGEFLYECEHCLYAAGTRKLIQRHYRQKHDKMFTGNICRPTGTRIYGYLCMDCNYVQMDRKAVEDHVNIYHLEEGKKIMKIYLSCFDHLKKTNFVQRSKPCPLSVKKKLEEAKQQEMEQNRIEPEKVEPEVKDQSPVQKPKRRYFHKSSVKRKTTENIEESVKKKIIVTDSLTSRRPMKEKTVVENRPQIEEEPTSRSEPEKENASKDVQLNLGRDTVEDMIQKLTDMLGDQTNSAEDRQELLLNLDKERTVLNAGFLSVVKDITGVEYICRLPFCSYKSKEREAFVDHWKNGHSDLNRRYKKSICQICQSNITVSSDNSLLLKFLDHVEGDHLGLRRKESTSQDNVTDVLNLLKTYLDKVSSNEARVEVKEEHSSVKAESQGIQEITSQPSEPQKTTSETTEVKNESVAEPKRPVKKEAKKSVTKPQYEWLSFGFLDVLKDSTSLEYVCRLPNCTFTTKETSKFLDHWNEDHDVVRNIHKIVTCLACKKIVTAARNQNILSLFFEHVKKEHLDKAVEKVEDKPKETVDEVVFIDSDSDEETTVESKKTPGPPNTKDETKDTSRIVKPSASSPSEDELVLNFQYLRIIITSDGIMYQCRVDNCCMQTVIKERILDHWKLNHLIGEVKCSNCLQNKPDLTSLFVHIEREHLNEIVIPKKSCSIPFTFKIAEVKSLATESPKPATPTSDLIKIKPLSSLTAKEPPQPDTSMAFKIAEVRSLAEDKPLKIANVMSLATPPPLRQYRIKPKSPEDKSAAALSVFLNNPNMLYKCPKYDCQYCTDDKNVFSGHIAKHMQCGDEVVKCVYCSLKTSLSKNVTHVDLHHSKCRYSCSQCLYRAVLKEYVVVHMKNKHKGDVKVVRLKTNGEQVKTFGRKMSVSQACHPFKCGHSDCGSEFLYQSEYYFHLDNFHGGYMTCGFKDANGVCEYKSVVADRMMDHWKIHNCYSFHCLKCKVGSTNLYAMLEHYSLSHPNSEPSVVDRRVAPRGGKVWGYTADACIGIKYVNDEVLKCVEPGSYTVEDPFASSLTIEIESSDEEEAEELSEEALMKKYGRVCSPVGKELKCPLCLEFTTKKPSYFVYHLLVELKCDRFKCNTCDYSCIPLDTMLAHCQDDHNNVITAGLTEIPINKKVEYWIQLVLKHQSKLILDKDVTIDGKDVQSQFFNTQCDFCQKWCGFRNIDLLNEHELCHWAEMTFGCGRCGEVRTPSLDEVFRHSTRAHPNEECLVAANAPSLVIPTWKSFPSKAANEKAKAEASASQSQEVFYGCLQCSHVAVASVEMLKKHQVECHGGDGKDFRCRILKKSEVEVRLMLCLTK